jgi:penicillin-binding protein 2
LKKFPKGVEIPYKFRDHAWFVAFAPYENPEIAVAVIVEHGGHGGAVAAPIARKIIQTYQQYYPLPIPTEEIPETLDRDLTLKANLIPER